MRVAADSAHRWENKKRNTSTAPTGVESAAARGPIIGKSSNGKEFNYVRIQEG